MLRFNKTSSGKVNVERTISNDYIGYTHRSYFQGINKFRFHPVQGIYLDANELDIISEFLRKENKNGL